MPAVYHFNAKRPAENLDLSQNHKLPGHVAKYLTNFQLDGIRFLYSHFKNNQSCILNDESGLGKTAMVSAFLDTVLPQDSSKKCLIILKNDERMRNWKFHLDILTRLSAKIVFKKEDIGRESLYLTKWDCLLKSGTLASYDFDCIIIDNRGDLMANKICSGYLLRNYENRISLIVSSSDVAVDLKQFHTMLRLCSRLDKKYKDFKIFEDKFSLPDGANMLESYFLRREKIINFCRDFRLRRYRHQYEDEIPLVQPEIYMQSLKIWAESPITNSLSSSSSIRILTSSSEKDAEQLLKSFFNLKEENDLNLEVSKITAEAEKKSNLQNNCEFEEMPPLFFESDEEDKNLERTEGTKAAQHEYIIPILVETDEDDKPGNKHEVEKNVRSSFTRSTRSNSKVLEKKPTLMKKDLLTKLQGHKIKKKKNKDVSEPARNLRSRLATRSKTQKNKYFIIDQTDDDRKLRKRPGRKRKAKIPEKYIKDEKTNEEIGKLEKKTESHDLNSNFHSTRSKVKNLKFKIVDNPDRINKRRKLLKKKLEKKSNPNRGDSNIKKGCDPSVKKVSKAKNNKDTIIDGKRTTEVLAGKQTAIKEVSKNKKQVNSVRKTSGDVHFVSPQDQIIVLSSSSEECTPSTLNGCFKQVSPAEKIMPSPDIFSTVFDECDISCSQKSKFPSGLKTLGLVPKTGILRNRNPSCLDILEQEFQKEKRNIITEAEEIFEISTSETIKSARVNDDSSETMPLKNRSATFQRNKITKYLIGTDGLSESLESNQPIEISDIQKMGESYPKTPMRQKIVHRRTTTSKKSPKATSGRDITPNSLTKWLIKSDTSSTTVSRPSKRRLDLWFND